MVTRENYETLMRRYAHDFLDVAKADYAAPLAYAAFLLRDVFRTKRISERHGLREAMVIYDGGDSVDVPLP